MQPCSRPNRLLSLPTAVVPAPDTGRVARVAISVHALLVFDAQAPAAVCVKDGAAGALEPWQSELEDATLDGNGVQFGEKLAGRTGFSAFTTLWEYGPEEAWRLTVTPDFVFEIPKLGVSLVGPDAAWGFRKRITGVFPNGTVVMPFSQSDVFGQLMCVPDLKSPTCTAGHATP